MSKPTPREALIKKIKACFHDSDAIDRATFANIEQLIHAEVRAVLNELEKKKETALYADFADGSVEDYTAIPLSAITQLKQRYGGKEQE